MIRLAAAVLACAALTWPAAAQPAFTFEDRFEAPGGWQWGTFESPHGHIIRYGRAPRPPAPRATLVVSQGFTAPIEKGFELLRDLVARDYWVWAVDWSGQGGSTKHVTEPFPRAAPPNFEIHLDEMSTFLDEVLPQEPGMAVISLSESMGAHLVTRFLAERPGSFDAAHMSAPMYGINTGGIPLAAARALAWTMVTVGAGHRYVPGGGDWHLDKLKTLEDNLVSQDPLRYQLQSRWFAREPSIVVAFSPSYQWFHVAAASNALVNDPAYFARVDVPVLLTSPKLEEIVLAEQHAPACTAMQDCTYVPFPNAKHVLWNEIDRERDAFLAVLDGWFDAVLGPARAAGLQSRP